jgi:hypothetical protein
MCSALHVGGGQACPFASPPAKRLGGQGWRSAWQACTLLVRAGRVGLERSFIL